MIESTTAAGEFNAEPAGALSTQLLAEFLAVVSALPEANAALEAAVERAALALEAEVAAVVCDGRARTSVGFPAHAVPHDELSLVATGEANVIDVPGAGSCQAIAVPLCIGVEGHLLIARSGADGFTGEEVNLARGMARVMELTFEMLRTLDAERRLRAHSDRQAGENVALLTSLRERQRLLEELSVIQRMISRREPLADVLDEIVRGAHELFGDEIVVLRQSEGLVPAAPRAVAWAGGTERIAKWLSRVPMPEPLSPGHAISPDKVVHRYEFPADGDEGGAPKGRAWVRSAIATPVHENGTVIGSLLVASHVEGRRYTDAEWAMLLAFAEHVSLAVTDANTLEAMYRAFHDSLTGLASRALFLDRLKHGLIQATRSKTNITLLFIDLDRFKMVNDTLGHSAGDVLLVEVAERLRGCLRASDTAARFGGDEFVVLLHGTNAADSEVVANRIIEAVRQPFTINGMDVFVDASIGIASSEAGSIGADDLLRDADVAMYRAKRAGRGRYATYEPQMHAALVERLQFEAELRGAVERGELAVHYQPIVGLATGEVVGVEALLRWNHPRHGLLVAEDFVPTAEECGVIVPIGTFALREACKQVAQWQAARPAGSSLTVSVNISAGQLEQPDLCAEVVDALTTSGLAASCLVLELTEGLILRDEPWVLERLNELKRLGVRLAIDDFGAGYSSLAAVRQLPVDIVKIDQSFIEAIGTSTEAAPFVRKMIELGHTLDLMVVAEGVQTREQFEELRRARCELGQGYYFAPPSSTDEPALLAQVDDALRLAE
ncbi:MAG: putative bifunctional diguanylate cyclase/phosphodiesterase [Acidothermaceae bacterium]